MAAFTTINDAGSFFNTALYSGNSSTQAITGVGFQPDAVWAKVRSTTYNHQLCDSVRGVHEMLRPNTTDAEGTYTDALTAFDSDGFTTGSEANWNETGQTYVAWNWKGGTTAVPSGGTITPSAVSFDATSGFGVYKYTGTGATATIAHGLGVAPRFMMFKEIDTGAAWMVYSESLGNGFGLILNTNSIKQTGSTYFNSTSPTTSVFTIGSAGQVNSVGEPIIAYVFAPVQGFSSFQSYIGNGNANGPFVYTGFKPAWVMLKSLTSTDDWQMYDSKREGYNPDNDALYANDTTAEATADEVDLLSNGFKIINTSSAYNTNGVTYVYFAFASNPFVNSEGVPGNAR